MQLESLYIPLNFGLIAEFSSKGLGFWLFAREHLAMKCPLEFP